VGRGQTGNRRDRWGKIAAEAAKQCGRAAIPKIHPFHSFEEVLAFDWGRQRRSFFGRKKRLGAWVKPWPCFQSRRSGRSEGGFSDEEARQAQAAGFQPVRLGPRILRAETAGVAIVACLQFILGDLNK